jgi:hypothetical protein
VWCAEVNAAMHSEIGAVPAERLEAEHELPAALPSLRLQAGSKPASRKVLPALGFAGRLELSR